MLTPASNDTNDQLDRIEAMLEIMLERVPDGVLGWSRTMTSVRVMENRELRAQHEAHVEKQREAAAAWKIPRDRRQNLLLQVLGDQRLTTRELTERLNAELGFPSPENLNHAVFDSQVRHLVKRMVREGTLARAEESFKNKPRNRYFRPKGGE